MIKILQIGMTNNLGGIESFIMNYYRHIDRQQIQFEFVNMYEKIVYEKEIVELGGKIHKIDNCNKRPFSCFFQLINVIKQNNYDIIHINLMSAANLTTTLASKVSGAKKIIVHSHCSNTPANIVRKILHMVNRPILSMIKTEKWACGYKAGNWLWGKHFNKNNIIPNAVDLRLICNSDERDILRKKLCLSNNTKVLGSIGRLCEQKNPLFLLDILAKVVAKRADTMLLMIGDGVLKDTFINKAKDMKLIDNIRMVGLQDNVWKWYAIMDCFLLPSVFEGLPVVGIEAQACGLPCFVSDTVTNELNITESVKYLSISNGGEVWANEIEKYFTNQDKLTPNIPLSYQISHAAKKLENKYLNLLISSDTSEI